MPGFAGRRVTRDSFSKVAISSSQSVVAPRATAGCLLACNLDETSTIDHHNLRQGYLTASSVSVYLIASCPTSYLLRIVLRTA